MSLIADHIFQAHDHTMQFAQCFPLPALLIQCGCPFQGLCFIYFQKGIQLRTLFDRPQITTNGLHAGGLAVL